MRLEVINEWRVIQRALGIDDDGVAGPATLRAVATKFGCLELWSAVQTHVGVTADRLPGRNTALAVARKMGLDMPLTIPTKSEIISGMSVYGRAGDEGNLVSIETPYLLYFDGKECKTIRVHRLVAERVKTALCKVLEHYGMEAIKRLKLDQFDGCFNNRSVRGGTSTSMHAWGIALDFYASANGMADKTGKAPMSGKEYVAWFDIWESVGARSFGRRNGYDWMHVEFVSPIVGGN